MFAQYIFLTYNGIKWTLLRITFLPFTVQLCLRNGEKASHSITSAMSYIGRAGFCCGWNKRTLWEGFSCTWKASCELVVGHWLPSIWTILKYFPSWPNASGYCIGKADPGVPNLLFGRAELDYCLICMESTKSLKFQMNKNFLSSVSLLWINFH